MKILFLDDSRERQSVFRRNTIGHIVKFASSADEAIAFLEKETFDQIWLDHDLEDIYLKSGSQKPTGRDVSKYLAENVDRHCRSVVVAHTLNHEGGKAMCHDLIKTRKFRSIHLVPFGWKDVDFMYRNLGIAKATPERK